ncbi:hypothetical protein [Methylocystis suflitae]|uniref:hypothetical protein n=1 Tax=Methylocystis suflitae TaxID=2951405 RepID=UPI00210AF1B1|nr:hypothetical protein [Methylocystis suflitae]MCQ4190956.1 hypothetical protein [Methylocystis suflitae]
MEDLFIAPSAHVFARLERRIFEPVLKLADIARSKGRGAPLLADFDRHAAKRVDDDKPRPISIIIACDNPDSIRERRFSGERPDCRPLV